MDHGLAQQLVAEVVREMSVIAGVDVALKFRRAHPDELRGHVKSVNA